MSFNILTESGDALLTESGDNLVTEDSGPDPDDMTIQQLMTQAACLMACVPEGMRKPILISLFAQIAGASMDPQTLMNNAACYAQCIPEGDQMGVLLYLGDQISSGGGTGGGSGQIVYYTTTDPITDGVVPADQTKAAIAVKPGATTYTWNKDLLTWDVPP